MIRLLSYFDNDAERLFLTQLAQQFSYLFDLSIFEKNNLPDELSPYQGQLVLDQHESLDLPLMTLTTRAEETSFQLPNLQLENWTSQTAFELAAFLTTAVQKLEHSWLDDLALHAALFNKDNQLIYHNQKPKDGFLFEQVEASPLPNWQFQEFQTHPHHVSHLLLPSISFDQILVESNQGLYQNGQFQGIFQQVWDIKPLLSSYLEETGQAIVGWSDVTSGASIKNNLFDDEF